MATIEPKQVILKDGTQLWVRSAQAGDVDGVITLRNDLIATSEHQVSGPGDEWPREAALEKIENTAKSPGLLWLVASATLNPGGEILGGINFRSEDRKRIEHHGSFGIGILKAWRGRGVGTVLIEVLLDWAAANAVVEKVTLGCFATNTGARKLYRRMGFKNEFRQKRFFKLGPGHYVDDIQMAIYVKPGVAPEGYETWQGKR